jgi:uncharacterized protein YcbX
MHENFQYASPLADGAEAGVSGWGMRIASLHTYPVKGCRRLDHDEAGIEPHGLAGDRRWMIVDDRGVGITQREVPRLSRLQARPRAGGLDLAAPGMPPRRIAEPVDGPKEFVRVFSGKPPVPVRLAAADGWLTEYLGVPARLTWQADPTGRPIERRARASDRVSMADAYPMLIVNTASLSALNDWLAEAGEDPVPITRFRPNLVVAGAPPWAEDGWLDRRLRVGAVTFRAAEACNRCVVTTVDQDTGERTGQPLKMLGLRRRFPDGLLFGTGLIPDVRPGSTGIIRAGDEVTLLS